MQYYAYKDRSLYEDILKQEIKEGSRLVYENAGFVAFCPFASRFPFEVTSCRAGNRRTSRTFIPTRFCCWRIA